MRIKRSYFYLFIILIAINSCSKAGGGPPPAPGPTTPEPTKPSIDPTKETPTNPPVGKIDEAAGFFVEVLGEGRASFNMHKNLETFDEPCKLGASDKTIDCYVEGTEAAFYERPMSLHFHVPSTMCTYMVASPFYFVNRKTKLQTATIVKYTDKNGAFGSAVDGAGLITSTDFGCYTDGTNPVCCVGEYAETTMSWDAAAAVPGWAPPATATVKRPLSACLGGPATQIVNGGLLGLPPDIVHFVSGVGFSGEYPIPTPILHEVGNAWITNSFIPAEHAGAMPAAFKNNIDIRNGETYDVGHPYYTFTCKDAAWETLFEVNVQLREWNTLAAYDARKTSPTAHSGLGTEPDPFPKEPKNDFRDWLDLEVATITYPGYTYK